MRRRVFLSRVGRVVGAFAGGGFVSTVAGGESEAGDPEYTILTGTKHETGVFVRGGGGGPTALVVGGMHGDERSGYRAARDAATWSVDGGTLVVLPEANPVAIERNTRENDRGDLNRKFPTGEEPTTELARAIWGVVERHDPNVVLDLHRSVGIYGLHETGVGQMIYPTNAGDAPRYAARTVDHLNDEVVPWHMPYHDYRRGGELTGSRPMLVHKVAGDLDRPGYIVETTEFLLDPRTRVRWTKRAATDLLSRHGIERRDG